MGKKNQTTAQPLARALHQMSAALEKGALLSIDLKHNRLRLLPLPHP